LKFISGMAVGMMLCLGTFTLSGQGQPAMHPRIAAAIDALKDARAYMVEAPHDFGGHKDGAIRACDNAIRQLQLALAYRATH
jgi:hypothetical protein